MELRSKAPGLRSLCVESNTKCIFKTLFETISAINAQI